MMNNQKFIGLEIKTGGPCSYVEVNHKQRIHGAKRYPIIELAIVIPTVTPDGMLDVEAGQKLVVGIQQSKAALTRFDEKSLQEHTDSGLLARIEANEGFDFLAKHPAQVDHYLMETLIEMGVLPATNLETVNIVLFGEHIERTISFLDWQLPMLASCLKGEQIDVASVGVLSQTLWSPLRLKETKDVLSQTALDDITRSASKLNAFTTSVHGIAK